MSLSVLVPTPKGAALFRVVEIEPADDPDWAPNEELGRLVFWFDPDRCGLNPSFRPVYTKAFPIVGDEFESSAVDQAEVPTSQMDRRVLNQRHYLVSRAQDVTASMPISRESFDVREGEDAFVPREFLTEMERSVLLHGDLAEVSLVFEALRTAKNSPPISGQDDTPVFEKHRADVEKTHAFSLQGAS